MIRPAEPRDLPAVLALLAEARLPPEGVAEHLGSFFVADEGGRIVASAGLERYGGTALLRSLAVAPEARGTGLGAAMIRHVLHEAGDGTGGVYALTTAAEGYLARFGFERASRASVPPELRESRQLQDACPDSAIVMEWGGPRGS